MPKAFPESISNQWKERVKNQRESGLTIAAWCRQNNFTSHTFYYWRDKFSPKATIKRENFKEIAERQIVDNENHQSGVCVQYQEFCIHLDQGFNMATLKQCLRALKELQC